MAPDMVTPHLAIDRVAVVTDFRSCLVPVMSLANGDMVPMRCPAFVHCPLVLVAARLVMAAGVMLAL